MMEEEGVSDKMSIKLYMIWEHDGRRTFTFPLIRVEFGIITFGRPLSLAELSKD